MILSKIYQQMVTLTYRQADRDFELDNTKQHMHNLIMQSMILLTESELQYVKQKQY